MSDSEDLKKLKGQIALALGSMGTALAQTLVEISGPRALEILRRRAMDAREPLDTEEHRDASLLLGTFVGALYEDSFFPTAPEGEESE